MRSRIYTIIRGHFKSWYRSKSNIFWTIAFPLLLIVLFGAIFGSGSTKFDLYLQNQDMSGNNVTIQLFMDQSDQASASLRGIVNSATISYAAAIARAPDHLYVQQVGIVTRNIRYIDFFIPGVIGMTLLTTGVFGAVNTNGRYRELKIIKKLATTPLSKIEWILGMVGYQMILA